MNTYSAEELKRLEPFRDANGWIPIAVYPPKKNTDVLFSDEKSIFIGHYAYQGRIYFQEGRKMSYFYPTYWQPKPGFPVKTAVA